LNFFYFLKIEIDYLGALPTKKVSLFFWQPSLSVTGLLRASLRYGFFGAKNKRQKEPSPSYPLRSSV